MFTIEQIHEAFNKVKTGEDFPRFVQDLKRIGVSHYDNFVTDGSTLFFGRDNFVLEGNSKYPSLTLNEESSSTKLKQAITIHQQGQSDYPTFCKQAADSGVQKWTTHMINMTVTYFDKFGNIMVEEKIPQS